VGIDSHSEKSFFSVQFASTYSIHSFPPPSRRTQQIQPFSQSGAAVCPTVRGLRKCCQCENVANTNSQQPIRRLALLVICLLPTRGSHSPYTEQTISLHGLFDFPCTRKRPSLYFFPYSFAGVSASPPNPIRRRGGSGDAESCLTR